MIHTLLLLALSPASLTPSLAAPVRVQEAPLVWTDGLQKLDMIADPDGGLLCLEFIPSSGTTPPSSVLKKYSKGGEVEWSFAPPFTARRVELGEGGRLFLTGQLTDLDTSFPGPFPTLSWDYGVVCLDADRNELWRKRVGGDLFDTMSESAPDGAGGIYITGNSARAEYGPAWVGSLNKVLVIRIAADGTELWRDLILGQFQDDRSVAAIALGSDAMGNIWVGTAEQDLMGDPARDRFTRFSPIGQVLAETHAPANDDVQLAFNAAGDALVTGIFDSWASGFSWPVRALLLPDATLAWEHSFGCYASSGVLNDDGTSVVGWVDATGGACSNGWALDRASVARLGADGLFVDQFVLPYVNHQNVDYVFSDGHGGAYVSFDIALPFSAFPSTIARVANLDPVGSTICPGEPNSSALPATLGIAGSDSALDNQATLFVEQMPMQATTLFIGSFSQGFVPNPAGSQGNLCLSGAVGRFNRPGQIMVSGQDGRVALEIDLAILPTPNATVAVMPGQSFYFQAWYRDVNPGATSNFSSAIEVVFQ